MILPPEAANPGRMNFRKGQVCNWRGGSKKRMIAEPKQQPHHKDRSKRERRRDEKALDEALKNTFPASDPVSVEQPALPAAHTQLSPANLN